ncbi:hypothetical protein LWC35_23980, partial [Pseudonocardia kujensis]|uniref:hypothetical protein n=1 Tax=Pseudonocardia kujensis TaxID=1128675 RepID=UPI001E5CAA2F
LGDALEAGPERLRDHLRRPYRPQQRKLAITEASYTVPRTVPLLRRDSRSVAVVDVSLEAGRREWSQQMQLVTLCR